MDWTCNSISTLFAVKYTYELFWSLPICLSDWRIKHGWFCRNVRLRTVSVRGDTFCLMSICFADIEGFDQWRIVIEGRLSVLNDEFLLRRSKKWCPLHGDYSKQFCSLVKGDCKMVWSGVEVFVFHWGCTRLGALGDDQRVPTVNAHGETEPLLRLLDIVFR